MSADLPPPDDGGRRPYRRIQDDAVTGLGPDDGSAPIGTVTEPADPRGEDADRVLGPRPPVGDAPGTLVETGRRRRRRHRPKATGWRAVAEWVAVIGGALVVALVIRAFFLGAFWIPSESMEGTLVKNDRVLVNKLSYKLHDVHRGDVVVFERPPAETDSTIKDLIKRVVALPGEKLELRDGQVLIDGRVLDEPYLKNDGCPGTQPLNEQFANLTIPDGQVFVMGDNRCNSADSRVFGPIDKDLIVGRAFVLIWPIGRWSWL